MRFLAQMRCCGCYLRSIPLMLLLSLLPSQSASALGPDAYASVSAGGNHTCAIMANGGAIDCWGLNEFGQLGNGTQVSTSHPARVTGITGATVVAAGKDHSCAVVSGLVKCWGFNGAGQLGDNSQIARVSPVNVTGISTAVSVAVGQQHTCAALANGTVNCWGSDLEGQLGRNSGGFSKIPVVAIGISTAVKVVAGEIDSCALSSTGSVYCWGNGSFGQLGTGGTSNSRVPVLVSGISNAVALAMGQRHACALLGDANATLACWGATALDNWAMARCRQALPPKPSFRASRRSVLAAITPV